MKKIVIHNISTATDAMALLLVADLMKKEQAGEIFQDILIMRTKSTDEMEEYKLTIAGGESHEQAGYPLGR